MSTEPQDEILSADDRERIKRSVETEQALVGVLNAVMTGASEDEVGDLAHDLADMWELAVKHHQRVQAILKMTGPADRRQLAALLADLFYADVDIELRFHLDSMRKRFPRLIEKLESKK